jgi:hypothetical protein
MLAYAYDPHMAWHGPGSCQAWVLQQCTPMERTFLPASQKARHAAAFAHAVPRDAFNVGGSAGTCNSLGFN